MRQPDQFKRVKQLRTEGERRALREARTMALLLAARLGCGDATCRDIYDVRAALDLACERVEGLLFDQSWGESTETREAVLA